MCPDNYDEEPICAEHRERLGLTGVEPSDGLDCEKTADTCRENCPLLRKEG